MSRIVGRNSELDIGHCGCQTSPLTRIDTSGSRPRPSDGQPLTGKVVRLYLLGRLAKNPTSSPGDSSLLNLFGFLSMKKPDVCLHTDESLGVGVVRDAEDLIDSIVGSDQHPKQEEAEYVHHVRTTIKR